MADDGVRIVIEGGIDSYMTAADETTAELLTSNEPLVTALREYDTYFREGLWRQHHPPRRAPGAVHERVSTFPSWFAHGLERPLRRRFPAAAHSARICGICQLNDAQA